MSIKIALAGNPNSGKTTMFNALTGSNQFVGNWPGVTVEKKEGKLKGYNDVIVTDLPGIYSLSPYTSEEVVSRNYLVDEHPDVILNIVDGTNLERNLFLTTQLTELGIPVVIAINMMDVVQKSGTKIDFDRLSRELGCKIVEISALKGSGITEAAEAAISASRNVKTIPKHRFSGGVEHTLAHIEEYALHDFPEEQQRFFAIKLFERDEKIIEKLRLSKTQTEHIEEDIRRREKELSDDSESIVISERYSYIDSIIKDCIKVKNKGKLTVTDKIDKVVTNRWLALPIFAVVMFIVYFISVTTVGALVTDWTNEGLFGEGWHFLGIGAGEFEDALNEYEFKLQKVQCYLDTADAYGINTIEIRQTLNSSEPDTDVIASFVSEAERAGFTAIEKLTDSEGKVVNVTITARDFEIALSMSEPAAKNFGAWVPGVPILAGNLLEAINCAEWLQRLIVDGIISGVGAVLGFVPQMLILFIFLAFLEACGYMARIAFILDRLFRRFGLSGKSFIPILIGTGCGVPGIMASRTIENEFDRKMTVITTTFIPCAAKLPIIALIAGALFNGAWWVAVSAYFIGMAAIVCSGIILKKTKLFKGGTAPFVMELPAYHMPTIKNILRSMWERGWSFIKKAGTVILVATVVIWFASNFGFSNDAFGMVEMSESLLAKAGSVIAYLFIPLGWGNWQATVATLTGFVAKESIVSTFGILYGFTGAAGSGSEAWSQLAANFTSLAGFSFLVFNLLCSPCFAAIGAIRREMNNRKWFWIAIGYQSGFAYAVALCIYQIGMLLAGRFGAGTVLALLVLAGFIFMLMRPRKKEQKLQVNQK